MKRPRCRCAHVDGFHVDGAGPCAVTLPAWPEEELPEWRCPCPRFVEAAGPWRWHEATQTWALPRQAAS